MTELHPLNQGQFPGFDIELQFWKVGGSGRGVHRASLLSLQVPLSPNKKLKSKVSTNHSDCRRIKKSTIVILPLSPADYLFILKQPDHIII